MSVKSFLKSKLFLKQIGLALLFTLILAWIAMMMMSLYTNRGQAIPTPDLSGRTVQEAEDMADERDLRAFVQDSMYQKGVVPGVVLRQSPAAGHKVKSGRKIHLTISSVSPEQVELPKVTDVSLRQARSLLEAKGFAIGKIEFRPSEFNDLVRDTQYEGAKVDAGTRLDNGSTVDLVVGKNLTDTESVIPDLTGLSFDNAQTILNAKALTIGMVLYDATVVSSDDSVAARIAKQSPLADSTMIVPAGTSVDIWLGLSSEQPVN